ncbi:DUF4116 domain-containing protein, partial [Mesomycoplasma molare]
EAVKINELVFFFTSYEIMNDKEFLLELIKKVNLPIFFVNNKNLNLKDILNIEINFKNKEDKNE